MCSTRSQVRFEEITINSSDMWGKKGIFLNVTSQEMRAMSRLGFSWLSPIHTEFFSQSSPAVPKHSSAFSGQQATVLSKKMFCFLFLTLLWVSPVSDCGHSHHSVGKLNPRLRITAEWWSPVGMKLTGALHWIFCALCALHPDCWLYSLCFFRHQSNGAVISRCGQPEVSWWGWRNADDEHLVQSVAKACASDSRSSSNKLMNGNCSRDLANGGDLSDVEFGKVVTVAFLWRAELYVKV